MRSDVYRTVTQSSRWGVRISDWWKPTPPDLPQSLMQARTCDNKLHLNFVSSSTGKEKRQCYQKSIWAWAWGQARALGDLWASVTESWAQRASLTCRVKGLETQKTWQGIQQQPISLGMWSACCSLAYEATLEDIVSVRLRPRAESWVCSLTEWRSIWILNLSSKVKIRFHQSCPQTSLEKVATSLECPTSSIFIKQYSR